MPSNASNFPVQSSVQSSAEHRRFMCFFEPRILFSEKKSSQMARSKVPKSLPNKKHTAIKLFLRYDLKVLQPPFIFFSQMSKLCFFLVQMSLSKKLITVWIQAKLAQGRLWRSCNLCCISTFSWREAETTREVPTAWRVENHTIFHICFTEISFRSLFSWKSYLLPSLHLKIPF